MIMNKKIIFACFFLLACSQGNSKSTRQFTGIHNQGPLLIYIDRQTGCHYIAQSKSSGIIKRYNPDGSQFGCIQKIEPID